MRRKGTPIEQYRLDLDFGVPLLIYLNSEEEYKEYIKWVLKRLYKKNIPVVIKNCKFYTKKTDFIGFIIKLRQINMDLKKIKAIIN